MRVLLLSDVNSAHTMKWAVSLHDHGIETGIFSLLQPEHPMPETSGISVWHPGLFQKGISDSGLFRKAGYLKATGAVKSLIRNFKPDIVHAHYGSSYGLLGALSRFHPFFLSVWGSDVFEFPKSSCLSRAILKYNFRKADRIFSTGQLLTSEAQKYTNREIQIIPFGVDTRQFAPITPVVADDWDYIVIGTVKALESIYGIDDLLRTFKILYDQIPRKNLKLIIAGSGTEEYNLKALAKELKIDHLVTFTGKIPHDQVPGLISTFDIFMNLSKHESFGVSVLEASACGIPVVATRTGGLTEVVQDTVTGILVPVGDPVAAAQAAGQLIANPGYRSEMGRRGRERVVRLFNWERHVEVMIQEYRDCCKGC